MMFPAMGGQVKAMETRRDSAFRAFINRHAVLIYFILVFALMGAGYVTKNTDQTDSAKATITVGMPLSTKVGSTVKAGSPARTLKAAVSGHD